MCRAESTGRTEGETISIKKNNIEALERTVTVAGEQPCDARLIAIARRSTVQVGKNKQMRKGEVGEE